MKDNLDTEKRYGSIKGIAGNAIGRVEALELPYSEDGYIRSFFTFI